MIPYAQAIEGHMKLFYESLSEKDRRRYAAVEAEKLGHGGMEYLARLFGCDSKPSPSNSTMSFPNGIMLSAQPPTEIRKLFFNDPLKGVNRWFGGEGVR